MEVKLSDEQPPTLTWALSVHAQHYGALFVAPTHPRNNAAHTTVTCRSAYAQPLPACCHQRPPACLQGDSDHALYLQLSRNFSKLACGGAAMTEAEKEEVRKLISCIQARPELAAQRLLAQRAAPKSAQVRTAAAPSLLRKTAKPKATKAANIPDVGANSQAEPVRRSARIQALKAHRQGS